MVGVRVNGSGRDERLQALAESGPRLAACEDLDELCTVGAELGRRVVQATNASIARVEHDLGRLRVLRNAGELAAWEQPAPADETYDLADFPLLSVRAEHARPWFGDLGDTATGEAHQQLLRAMGMYSSISIPLVSGSRVWGELGAARREALAPYAPIDVAAGETFAALFVANLQRLEEDDELRQLAFHDGLTGLGNRRALDDRLEAAFLAASGGPRQIAVILSDVDGLKRVNDHHGHEIGDQVLREVAARLSRVIGSYPDVLAARLGGDEFAIVLTDVDDSEVARLTRSIIADARDLPFGAGLSCGWASTSSRPEDARDAAGAARGLLRLADAAQYRAKRHGRDDGRTDRVERRRDGAATEQAASLTRRVLTQFDGVHGVLERLVILALACTEAFDGSASAVSLRVDGGPLVVVGGTTQERSDDDAGPQDGDVARHEDDLRHLDGDLRRHDGDLRRHDGDLRRHDGDLRRRIDVGTSHDLALYPATRAVLTGGALYANLDEGDRAERAFLAAMGHDELIVVGVPQDATVAWLLEVYGDALSSSLRPHAALIEALTALAVRGGRSLEHQQALELIATSIQRVS
jgi:diguanylate cyclase (GGDEF)-like protein